MSEITEGIGKTIREKALLFFLWIVAWLINVKSIFADFGYDNAYALVTSWRHIRGDRLLGEMWEPHQTSSFVADVLLWLWGRVTGGSEYSAIFLQISGTLIFFIVAILLICVLKKITNEYTAYIIGILFFVARPKFTEFPEFTNLIIVFSALMLICVIQYLTNKKDIWLVGAGAMLALQCLAYPTCLISIVPVAAFVFIISSKKWRSVLLFIVGGAFVLLTYGLYVLSNIGLSEMLANVINIFSADSSHSNGFLNMNKPFEIDVKNGLFLIYPICMIVGSFRIKSLKAEAKTTVFFSYVVSIFSCLAVLMLTNQSISTVFGYAEIGGLLALIPIMENNPRRMMYPVTLALTIVVMFVQRGLIVDGYSALGNSGFIWDIEKSYIRIGAQKGIISTQGYSNDVQGRNRILAEYVTCEDTLLIRDNWIYDASAYMDAGAGVAHYSTIDTASYNEKLLEYWKLYENKRPTVVVKRKNSGNGPVDEYIEANYDTIYEDDYWIVYR